MRHFIPVKITEKKYADKFEELADRVGVKFSQGETFVDSAAGTVPFTEYAVYDPETSELVVYQECETYPLECVGGYWTGVSSGLWDDICSDYKQGYLFC